MKSKIPDHILNTEISKHLSKFREKASHSLRSMDLDKMLRSKNPFLQTAMEPTTICEFIDRMVDPRFESSAETQMGKILEEIVQFCYQYSRKSQRGTTVQTSPAPGSDISIETAKSNTQIAVKSGTRVFNSQSKSAQLDQFRKIKSRLNKTSKRSFFVIAYCYGSKKPSKDTSVYRELVGAEMWEDATLEKHFHLRLLQAFAKCSRGWAGELRMEVKKTKNRLVKEFSQKYVLRNGKINWEKLYATAFFPATAKTGS